MYIVESDPLRLVGYRALLEGKHGMRVESGPVVPNLRENLDFDVALLSAHTEKDMFDLIGSIRAAYPEKRVLVTGPKVNDEVILQAITAGSKGYIEEESDGNDFAEAIRVVHGGSIWAPRRVLAAFVERAMTSVRKTRAQLKLTERERAVLQLLVAGRSNKEIGTQLDIEERTVKAHVAKLMVKVGVTNRISLSVHAVTQSLLK
ncbi:MAG: response regulator transcription factor [Acidobacteriaceae bacterium]